MPDANHLAAIDTLLAVFVTLALGGRVGYLRERCKIVAPATSGHPDFERAFRTHLNTVENLIAFIPALWVATAYYGGTIPFWIGLVWVVSRLVYAVGYAQADTRLRAPGAITGILCIFALLVLGAIGVVQ